MFLLLTTVFSHFHCVVSKPSCTWFCPFCLWHLMRTFQAKNIFSKCITNANKLICVLRTISVVGLRIGSMLYSVRIIDGPFCKAVMIVVDANVISCGSVVSLGWYVGPKRRICSDDNVPKTLKPIIFAFMIWWLMQS